MWRAVGRYIEAEVGVRFEKAFRVPRKGPVNPVAVRAAGELGEICRGCGGQKSIVRVVANAVRSVHVRIAAQMTFSLSVTWVSLMGDWRKNWSLRNICHDQFLAFLAERHVRG